MPEKTVYAFVKGGIGNQLFIYAAARRIAHKNDARLVLLADWYEDEPHGRHFLLDKFRISADIASTNDAGIPYLEKHHILAKRLNRYHYSLGIHYPHYLPERNKNFIGQRRPVDNRVIRASTDDYLFLDGLFQNEGYFKDITEMLRADLALQSPISRETRDIAERIMNTESVCIHFRRTEIERQDMLSRHGEKKWLGGYVEGLGLDYYRDALEQIGKETDTPHYFCFSDQPDWVQKNFRIEAPVTYVTHNNTPETCHEDLYLMGQCKHHVISHSTFGWWGAWLAHAAGQLVVAPVNVCGRRKPPDYPDTWSQIRVCQKKVE